MNDYGTLLYLLAIDPLLARVMQSNVQVTGHLGLEYSALTAPAGIHIDMSITSPDIYIDDLPLTAFNVCYSIRVALVEDGSVIVLNVSWPEIL
jgi:hypothetical protein